MIKKSEIIGLSIAGFIVLISSILLSLNLLNKINFFDSAVFYFILGIALVIGGVPFFFNLIMDARREENINQMFLEFARDLVEGVKSGTPISKSVINVRNKDYGSLSPFVKKLANQIAMGIPVKFALETFAKEVNSPVIRRAVGLIREAETSGGRIESILESVTFSVAQIEKLKKERKAAIYNLTVQGYIIFIIFIVIMLVMRFKILTIVGDLNIGTEGASPELEEIGGLNVGQGVNLDPEKFAAPFFFLLICQGLFAGIVIGKLSEGNLKAGFRHSFVMVTMAWLASKGAELIFR